MPQGGRFGPAHDGIDGDYGKATERIVKDFQKNKVKALFGEDPGKQVLAKFGQTVASARTDGAIDWLTLIALDIWAAAHESAPPAPTPPVTQPAGGSPSAPPADGEISLEDAKVILLKCTAVFEGAWDLKKDDFNFGILSPNFDLAGLSMGLIQWNIKSRNVFPLLKEMHEKNPDKFKECYEGGDPERFKGYFGSEWKDEYGKDVWKYSEFVKFISTSSLKGHFLWVKLLHKPIAIKSVTKPPKWKTKDVKPYGKAEGALRLELIDFFRRLGEVKEFQDIQYVRAWEKYGGMAISDARWLKSICKPKYSTLMEKIELRTFVAIFDLEVQQGGFGNMAKDAIASAVASSSYSSQKEIAEMAVRERARTAGDEWQNDCASRRLGFLNAKATVSSDLKGKAKTVVNCNYKLLEENPYVQGI